MDLRIGRLVQIMSAIRNRIDVMMKMRHAELEWQTKAITYFISNTIDDPKGREAMVGISNDLTLSDKGETKDDRRPVPRADTKSERSLEDIMENGNVEGALERNNRRKTPMPFMPPPQLTSD